MKIQIFNIICNIASLIAAIITIIAAIQSRKSLSQIEIFKEKIYRKEHKSLALERLKNIISTLPQTIIAEGKNSKFNNIIRDSVYVLIDDNKLLIKECKNYINIIDKTQILDKNNVDDFITSIKAIIRLYKRGEKNGL